MSFLASDCAAGVTGLLMNRSIATTAMMEALRKAVLELTTDFKHPLLEDTGPIVSLTAYQNSYEASFFLQTAEAPLDVNKVNSFFIFNNPYSVPSLSNLATNAGYDLKFRSPDSIEVLLNISGLPMYWTRNNNLIYLASTPDNAYSCYIHLHKL
jgi:hypothetical protein